jgi:polyisoprenoid-binding protein YceI
MKRFAISLTLVLTFLLPALASAATSTWVIDADHSSIQFKVKHLMVSNVKGEFKKFSGALTIDDADITRSKVDVTIDATSIDTGNAKRDEHLRSPDFLDVAKNPTLKFVSTKVAKSGDGTLKVTGTLMLHGVSREVVLDVEGPTSAIKDPWGNTKRGASATTKINRKDFGLTWNKALETGGVVVGDEVAITLEVELLKK